MKYFLLNLWDIVYNILQFCFGTVTGREDMASSFTYDSNQLN